jgi:hypothetical protein
LTPQYFAKLPLDAAKEIALSLPYASVINLCKTSKRLHHICQDNDSFAGSGSESAGGFWKRKLKRDYPEENLSAMKSGSYRGYYQILYAQELRAEGEEITNLYAEDPEYIDAGNEMSEITREIRRLDALRNEAERKRMDIERTYKDKGRKIIAQSYQLTEKAMEENKNLFVPENKYIEVVIPERDIGNLVLSEYGNAPNYIISADLLNYLKAHNPELAEGPKEGNFIGIRASNSSPKSLPTYLIYVFRDLKNPMKLHYNTMNYDEEEDDVYVIHGHYDLPHMFPEGQKEFEETYHPPFATGLGESAIVQHEGYESSSE